MSSILEALKKLEADKNAHLSDVVVPEPAYTQDSMSNALLGNFADPAPNASRISPILLVLGGGIFTVLLIGVSVLLALFLVKALQAPAPPADTLRAAVAPPAIEALPVDESSVVTPVAAGAQADAATAPAPAPASEPETAPAPQRPKPRPAAPKLTPPTEVPIVSTPVALPEEVRYEPYIPKPAASTTESAPLPADLRTLPMLSREDRATYGLENVRINMLNEASPTRPLGNALVNLEKIFIGETLPGSNAKLVDVKSHGIAVEILSTRQRYYIPR